MRGEQKDNKWVWETVMEIGVDRNCNSSKAWKNCSEIRRQGRNRSYKRRKSVNEENTGIKHSWKFSVSTT